MPSARSSPTPPDRPAADRAFRAAYAEAIGRAVTAEDELTPRYRWFRGLYRALYAFNAQMRRARLAIRKGEE